MGDLKIDSRGFDNMVRALHKKTAASYKDVLKATAGAVLENAARKTYSTKLKTIRASVEKIMSRTFTSSTGDKIRKAKDGSLIIKPAGLQKWIFLRREYDLSNVSKKRPTGIGTKLSPRFQSRVNSALSEYRKAQKNIIANKKTRIASSQKSFLEIMKKLRIPIRSSRGLGKAMKAKITSKHGAALRGSYSISDRVCSIIIRSKSRAALNPKSGGIFQFGAALNGQAKAFKIASKKNLKTYTEKFAQRNGFSVR